MSDEELIIVTPEENEKRLDIILAQRYHGTWSRSYFQKLITQKQVLLNGTPVKKHVRPQEGDEVQVQFIFTPEVSLQAEEIPLEIIYEDEHLLVINKPAGMVVHPAPGHWTGTFVNALLYHCKQLDYPQDSLRPGIVHRLDKETSGLLVAAKTGQVHQRLVDLFSSRQVHKEYLALTVGNPGDCTIETQIGRHPIHRKKMAVLTDSGREAITICHPVAKSRDLSLVQIILKTGRTHQIRVHLLHKKCPVLGDSLYGSESANKRFSATRQMLHAHRLRFIHPMTNEPLELEAPLPEDIQTIMSRHAITYPES